jgi:hypothetical protein
VQYWLYGVSLDSDFSFPFDQSDREGFTQISLREWMRHPAGDACTASNSQRLLHLKDGSTFLRWPDLFECIIDAAGREIKVHCLGSASVDSFYSYLLGQAVSIALLKQGVEQFHATVLSIAGKALALTGDCGRGKSTLAGALLRQGAKLLVDDMLVLREERGTFTAYPGPAALKLMPDSARAFDLPMRKALRMNALVEKRIYPIRQAQEDPVALRHIYALTKPSRRTKQTRIRRCSPSQSCIELVAAAYNLDDSREERMARQLDWAATVSRAVPVSRLSFPRKLEQVDDVAQVLVSCFMRGET